MLNCTAHEVGAVVVITLEDPGTAGDDRQSVDREMLYKAIQSRDDASYAVDLGNLDYMSSADFGFLISMKRRIDAKGGKLVLFAASPFIENTMETMKIRRLFTIANDLAGAILALSAG